MSLFESFRLTAGEVERRIERPLGGDPGRGEIGVLAALRAGQLDRARTLLQHDPELGEDFRSLLNLELERSTKRWGSLRNWRVRIPQPVWEVYARESRVTHTPIGECLSAAIQRDFEGRCRAALPAAAQEDLGELLERLERLRTSLEPLLALARRLGPVEECVTGARR